MKWGLAQPFPLTRLGWPVLVSASFAETEPALSLPKGRGL